MPNPDLHEGVNLNPIEVSLTIAPAVREEFLMTKSALTKDRLQEIAKSLGLDSVDDIPDEEIKKAIDEEEGDEKDKMARLRALQGKTEKEDKEKIEKASDATKSALMVAKRVLSPYMSELPDSISKALADLPKEDEDEEDPEKMKVAENKKSEKATELLKSSFPGVIEAIQKPLMAEIKKSQDRVQALEDASEQSEMLELAKSMPGDPVKTASRLRHLKKSMKSEEFEEFTTEQQGLFAQISKSEIFKQYTDRGEGNESASAESRVMSLAKSMVAKSEKPGEPNAMAKAIEFVLDSNPALSQQYHSEMTRASAASSLEG